MKLFQLCALVAMCAPVLIGQPGTGSVTGQVFDASNGQAIRGVAIEVNGQSSPDMVTDTVGRFTLQLSPGTYKLRFTAPRHAEATVDDIQVVAGEVTEASTVMQVAGTVTTVDVVEKIGAVAATAEAMLTERKLAQVVSDGLNPTSAFFRVRCCRIRT